MHPSGSIVYTSNRRYDHIEVLALGDDGKPSLVDDVATVKTPRDIDPSGQFLIAAGKDDGKLQVYAIAADGKLSVRGAPISGLPSPVVVTVITRAAR